MRTQKVLRHLLTEILRAKNDEDARAWAEAAQAATTAKAIAISQLHKSSR
jgi:hypothetical protein